MIEMSEAITRARSALAEIDVAAAQRERDEHTARVDEIEEAIARAKSTIAELEQRITAREYRGPDPRAAADAVLAGAGVLEADPSPAMLRDELEGMIAARSGLAHQLTDAKADREAAQRRFANQVAAAASPIAEALRGRLAAAAAEILSLYAAANELRQKTRGSVFVDLVGKLHATRAAIRDSGLASNTPSGIPADVEALLAEAAPLLDFASRTLKPRQ